MTPAVIAQELVRVRPLLTVTETYDSNISSSSLRPFGDFVTRVSPGIEAEYTSPLTKMQARYTTDLERYAREPSLSSSGGRHAALVDLRYTKSRRGSLGVEATYTQTNTPSDLTTVTGLILERAAAERIEVRPSLVRELDPLTSATIEYAFSADRLAGGTGTRAHRAAVNLDRQISRRDRLAIDYEVRQWTFQPGGRPTSQLLRVGWSRPVTRLLAVELQGGPIVTDGRASSDLAATIRHATRPADLALSYARTQTTIVGLSGVADTQSLTASGSIKLRPGLQLRVSPGVSRTLHDDGRTDAWHLGFEAERRVGHVALRMSYDASAQRGRLLAVSAHAAMRHLVQVSVFPISRARER
jgi:hypothetical protein